MKKWRFSVVVFLMLMLCSAVSMTIRDGRFLGGGGAPTPCLPPGSICTLK